MFVKNNNINFFLENQTMLKSIGHHIATKAAKLAQTTGENVVVFIGEINDKAIEMIATVSQFDASPMKASLEVLGTIDSNGNITD